MVDKISCIAALVVLVLLAILIYRTQIIDGDDDYDHYDGKDIDQQNNKKQH